MPTQKYTSQISHYALVVTKGGKITNVFLKDIAGHVLTADLDELATLATPEERVNKVLLGAGATRVGHLDLEAIIESLADQTFLAKEASVDAVEAEAVAFLLSLPSEGNMEALSALNSQPEAVAAHVALVEAAPALLADLEVANESVAVQPTSAHPDALDTVDQAVAAATEPGTPESNDFVATPPFGGSTPSKPLEEIRAVQDAAGLT